MRRSRRFWPRSPRFWTTKDHEAPGDATAPGRRPAIQVAGMKKFMNDPARMASESLVGFVAAHGDLVEFGPNQKFVRRRTLSPGKVGIISGGGAGHEPLHVGFVGRGMLDAACPGQFFTSPTPDQIAAAIESVDQGAGVLLIVKNYDGDVMNFEMAAEIAGGARDRFGNLDHWRRRGGHWRQSPRHRRNLVCAEDIGCCSGTGHVARTIGRCWASGQFSACAPSASR